MVEAQAAAAQPGSPTLHVENDGLATITLNRPQHLNRLHREDLQVLQNHFQHLATHTTARVLVLTGSGAAFCAGFNIQELQQSGESASADPQLFQHTVDALENLPLPTVARLNGSVYGGATDLALACDFRVGVHGMELRMPAAHLGLHYYASGLQRYVSRLGLQTAKRLFLLAQAVQAGELLRLGYLDSLVAPADLDAEVQTWVQQLQRGAPLAVQGMKQSLNELAAAGSVGSADLHNRIRAREARCAASNDLQKGLAAFAARRTPRFSGA